MTEGPCGPALTLERDLFGNFAVTRQWGRVGTTGRVITEPFETELEAAEAMAAQLLPFFAGIVMPLSTISWVLFH